MREFRRGFAEGMYRTWPALLAYGGVVLMLEDAWLNGTTWVTLGFGAVSLVAWSLPRVFRS